MPEQDTSGRSPAAPVPGGKRPKLGLKGTVTIPEPEEHKVTAIEARNAIEDIFKRIGCIEDESGHAMFPETIFPAGNKNTAPQAREFATAKALKSLAERRYKAAEEAARAAGVLGDESEYVEGQTRIVWSGASFDITAKRNAGSKSIDKDLLREVLPSFGIAASKVEDVIEAASKPRKGATTIDVAMKS